MTDKHFYLPTEKEQEWGDKYTSKKSNSIRIWFVNPNGIRANAQDPKSYDSFMYLRYKSKADIFGMAETNVHWSMLEPSNNLNNRISNFWRDYRYCSGKLS